MQRLRGSDAFTVYSETSKSPFVTVKVAIYSPTPGNSLPPEGDLLSLVEQAVAKLGATRAGLRIVRVPLNLHHPVWVNAPGFALKNHIHETRLPSPGTKEQLCDFISELMGKPLDSRLPLWEIWIVRGLERERLAMVFKVHHAFADGRTMARLIELAHTTRRSLQPPEDPGLAEEPFPGKLRLVGDALVDLMKSFTVELPQLYRHVKRFRAQAPVSASHEKSPVAPFQAPYTRLDAAAEGRERIYRYETFSLATLKSLSHTLDSTLNSLILAICSEALRRYLQDLDSVPAESLMTAIAIGQSTDEEPVLHPPNEIHNNRLAVAYVPLFQNIVDFEERLAAIKEAAKVVIEHARTGPGQFFDSYLDFTPAPVVQMMMGLLARRQKKHQRPCANVVISNVPGPREKLFALDGRLEMQELLSVGNLTDVANLNITVWSYADNLTFSFFFRKGALPRPESLVGHICDVVAELLERYAVSPPGQAALKNGCPPPESPQKSVGQV